MSKFVIDEKHKLDVLPSASHITCVSQSSSVKDNQDLIYAEILRIELAWLWHTLF